MSRSATGFRPQLRAERTEMQEDRDGLRRSIADLRAAIKSEGRSPSAKDLEIIERCERKAAKLDERIEDLGAEIDAAEGQRSAPDPRGSMFGDARGVGDDENTRGGSPARDAAQRSVERLVNGHNGVRMDTRRADQIDELLRNRDARGYSAEFIAAISEPAYRSAFLKVIMNQRSAHLRMSPQEHSAFARVDEARAAINIGTGDDGGYAVPIDLDPTFLIDNAGAIGNPRSFSRVEVISSSPWKGVTTAGVTLGYSAEGTPVAANNPTLTQPVVTPHRVLGWCSFTIEAQQDIPNLGEQLVNLISDERNVVEANKFTNGAGDGSNEPHGFISALSGTDSEVETATASTFAAVDVYSLIEALSARWQPNATFVANIAILNAIRRFQTIGEPMLFSEDGKSLLGKPYVELSPMTATQNDSDEILACGDFSQFLVVDRLGMTIEPVEHLFDQATGELNGQRAVMVAWRNGSDVLIEDAFRLLKVKPAS